MLRRQRCKPGATKLDKQAIDTYAQELDKWVLSENKNTLEKKFEFNNFSQALEFTNEVGRLAEQENHHPDIYLSWGKVIIMLSTHDCGGLSLNDFILAAKIDRL